MTESTIVVSLSQEARLIPVDAIRESQFSLRLTYDEASLDELGDSLQSEGQLAPIVVSERDNAYDLIIGSRRLRAARKKQLSEIRATIVATSSPLSYFLMALAENLHRRDLNPFEEGAAYVRLMKDYDLPQTEIARRVHKDKAHVLNRIQLLTMPEEVKLLVANNRLGLQHIGVLAPLPSGADQISYAERSVRNRLTQAELRLLIQRETKDPRKAPPPSFEMTAEKIRMQVEIFVSWVKKVPSRSNLKSFNVSEQQDVGRALYEAETELKTLRGLLSIDETGYRPQEARTNIPGGQARNFGEEWPAGDVAAIMAPNRPSDDILATQLGRTVDSIKDRRRTVRREERTKARR